MRPALRWSHGPGLEPRDALLWFRAFGALSRDASASIGTERARLYTQEGKVTEALVRCGRLHGRAVAVRRTPSNVREVARRTCSERSKTPRFHMASWSSGQGLGLCVERSRSRPRPGPFPAEVARTDQTDSDRGARHREPHCGWPEDTKIGLHMGGVGRTAMGRAALGEAALGGTARVRATAVR